VEQPEILQTASDGLSARLTGLWVHDKKYYLERYLDIVSRGVGPKWEGRLSYIDLFSGPGKSIIRGGDQEIDGSPLIALKHGFSNYVFIDIPEIITVLKKRDEFRKVFKGFDPAKVARFGEAEIFMVPPRFRFRRLHCNLSAGNGCRNVEQPREKAEVSHQQTSISPPKVT